MANVNVNVKGIYVEATGMVVFGIMEDDKHLTQVVGKTVKEEEVTLCEMNYIKIQERYFRIVSYTDGIYVLSLGTDNNKGEL